MMIELKPETEQMVRSELENGHVVSIDELIVKGIRAIHGEPEVSSGREGEKASKVKHPASRTREERRQAVRRMIEFGERNQLSLGEPITRAFLHEGHRF